jgi:hypothetical protein
MKTKLVLLVILGVVCIATAAAQAAPTTGKANPKPTFTSPVIVANVLVNATSDVTETTLFTPSVTGVYRITWAGLSRQNTKILLTDIQVYVLCTISYLPAYGLATITTTCSQPGPYDNGYIPLHAMTWDNLEPRVILAKAGSPITYAANLYVFANDIWLACGDTCVFDNPPDYSMYLVAEQITKP